MPFNFFNFFKKKKREEKPEFRPILSVGDLAILSPEEVSEMPGFLPSFKVMIASIITTDTFVIGYRVKFIEFINYPAGVFTNEHIDYLERTVWGETVFKKLSEIQNVFQASPYSFGELIKSVNKSKEST